MGYIHERELGMESVGRFEFGTKGRQGHVGRRCRSETASEPEIRGFVRVGLRVVRRHRA